MNCSCTLIFIPQTAYQSSQCHQWNKASLDIGLVDSILFILHFMYMWIIGMMCYRAGSEPHCRLSHLQIPGPMLHPHIPEAQHGHLLSTHTQNLLWLTASYKGPNMHLEILVSPKCLPKLTSILFFTISLH